LGRRAEARNSAHAEDLLHSAFLRMGNYQAAQVVKNPTAFLVRTAVNIGVDNYRRNEILGNCALEEALNCANHDPLPDEVACARARLQRVQAGLDKLPKKTREVFLMHRLEGLKYREIAARVGISQSAVEKHIAKAALFLTDWTDGW
jgi:RNA polymerase sigma factor (sigma-70 family)